MKRYKVLVDTSVLVSASISSLLKELNMKLTHPHYKSANPLFDFFSKHIDKKIGIFTKATEIEADTVLAKAVRSEVKSFFDRHKGKIDKLGVTKRLLIFSAILTESTRNLEKNKDYLIRETVNEEEVKKTIPEVVTFYIGLKDIMSDLNKARDIKKKEDRQDHKKLVIKLVISPPRDADHKLLAEAISFKKVYKVPVYIASTDYHFVELKPDRSNKFTRFVPKHINKRFKIKCRWPDRMAKFLRKKRFFLL